jgi:hypothetical protein
MKRKKPQDRKRDHVEPKKKVSKTVSREETHKAQPFGKQLNQYSECDDSSLEPRENSRTSHCLREKKAKAPSIALSTSPVSSLDLQPLSQKLVIWLDVNETKPGVMPKPALSEHNFHKLETSLSATRNFVAVRRKVQEFVALSDEFITDGLTIHEGLQMSLTHGAYYSRVKKYNKGNCTTTKMHAVDGKNWNGLVAELGDFSQDDCVDMDVAILVTKDSALESTNSSVVNSLLAPLSTPAKKNVLPDYALIGYWYGASVYATRKNPHMRTRRA